jgi:hypothetical protein
MAGGKQRRKQIAPTFASIAPLGRTSTGLMVLTPRFSTLGRKVIFFAALACSKSSGDGSTGAGTMEDASTAPPAPDGSFGFNPVEVGGGQGGAGGVPGVSGAYPCLDNQMGACAGTLYKGQSLPTDLFVMFDQSGSMLTKDMDGGGLTRLDAVRNGVYQFLKAPESAGLGVGIGYFGYHPLSCMCTSCNPADYATPKVEIGELPGQAAALMASLGGIEPTGETPTGAAIRGACTYAKARKAANPMRNISILLVTDGEPKAPLSMATGCNPTLEDAVAAAGECAAAGISTYVLGVGPSLDNLNKIAAAGQTKNAYLVAAGGTPGIIKALSDIRSNAMIPCQMQIPGVGTRAVDFQKVNVVYADAACKASTFNYVESVDRCGSGGGWYYDNKMAPTQINLCNLTCEQVKAAGGQLVVSVGCMTQVIQ